MPGSRIPGPLMGRKEEHRAVRIKNLLCSVSVMDVPVNDGDALHRVGFLCIARRDGNVVEEAEAHRCGWPGMMAWRTHGTESVLGATAQHGIHGINASPDRVQGYLARLR